MCSDEENWCYEIDISKTEDKFFLNFELQINKLSEWILKTIDNSFRGEDNNITDVPNNENEIRDVIENNKNLRQQIDTKLKELQQSKSRYETFKQDQKLLSQEVKEKHEAFLMAKKYYKKFLKIYFTIESKNSDNQTIFVQFFNEARKESEKYSIRLSRNPNSGTYELLSTNPQLKNFKEIQKKLRECNDIPGALCCIRQSFLTIKGTKRN